MTARPDVDALAQTVRVALGVAAQFPEARRAPAALDALVGLVRELEAALAETWEDVSVLLDKHVSSEVSLEARRRLIERFADDGADA